MRSVFKPKSGASTDETHRSMAQTACFPGLYPKLPGAASYLRRRYLLRKLLRFLDGQGRLSFEPLMPADHFWKLRSWNIRDDKEFGKMPEQCCWILKCELKRTELLMSGFVALVHIDVFTSSY